MYGICSVLLLHFFTVLSSAGENIDQYTKYFTRMNFTPTAKKVCKVCSLIILLYALESNLFFFCEEVSHRLHGTGVFTYIYHRC